MRDVRRASLYIYNKVRMAINLSLKLFNVRLKLHLFQYTGKILSTISPGIAFLLLRESQPI